MFTRAHTDTANRHTDTADSHTQRRARTQLAPCVHDNAKLAYEMHGHHIPQGDATHEQQSHQCEQYVLSCAMLTGAGMCPVTSVSASVTARAIRVRWSRCGLRRRCEIWRASGQQASVALYHCSYECTYW